MRRFTKPILNWWPGLLTIVTAWLLTAHAGAQPAPVRLKLQVETLELDPGATRVESDGRTGSRDTAWLLALMRQLVPIEGPAAGRVIPNARLPAAQDVVSPLDLTLAIGRLSARSVNLQDVDARLVARPTELVLAPVRANGFGGRLEAELHSQGQRPNLRFRVSNNLSRLDIPTLIRLADAGSGVSGRLSLRAMLEGNGNDLYAWLASARGQAHLLIEEGEIPGGLLDLWGGDLITNLLPRTTQETTRLQCLIAIAKVANGTMTLESLVLDTPEVLVLGSGSLSLKTEALDIELRPRPKHVTLFTAATPVRIAGTLAKPQIEVMKLALLRKALTLTLTGFTPEGLLSLFEGENEACRQALAAAKR